MNLLENIINQLNLKIRGKNNLTEEEIPEIDLKKTVEEGKKEGVIEGRKEGKIKGKQEVALELLKQGIDIDIIIKSTGLTKEQVERLKE